MLSGNLDLEFVPDTSTGNDNDTEEELELDDTTLEDVVAEDDKYASSYPNAFAFLEGHSTDTNDLVSFEILDCINGNTFVYAYQTLDKANSSDKTKVMASVLMSYNYQTKEKNVIWKLTSSVTESKSFFTQPIYKDPGNNASAPQCIGYLAFFNGQIFIYNKTDKNVLFSKNISTNLKNFYEENRDKSYNSGSYEVNEVTVDGDFSTQLNLHIKLVIISKDIDSALEGEPVPTVSYDSPNNNEAQEDSDVNNDTYGIKNYSVLYTITSLGKMTFTSKNINFDNQVKAWKDNGSTGSYGNSFGDCIMSNDMTLLENHNTSWVIPWCAAGSGNEINNFSWYSHVLKKKGKTYYEIYGTIEKMGQTFQQATRSVKTKDDKGNEIETTYSATFLYSNTFTFADGLYGISCTFTQDDASYAYLYGNYILNYKEGKISVLKSTHSGIDHKDIYDTAFKAETENNISAAEGIFLDGNFYSFVTDDKYLYLYDMSGKQTIKISVEEIFFYKKNAETLVTPSAGDQVVNPDIYRARGIRKIGDKYYIASIYSGLSIVDAANSSNVQQASTHSCYGVYTQGSSYIVLGFVNDKTTYTVQDMIHAKCIPLSDFRSK